MKIYLLSKKSLLIYSFMTILITFVLLIFSVSQLSSYATLGATYDYSDYISQIHALTSKQEKIAYLTFDDGPNPSITPKVLDILKEEDVKATFFVVGKAVEAYPEIVKRAYEEGHFIANHGYSHNNSILYKNSETFLNEIKKTDLAIRQCYWNS